VNALLGVSQARRDALTAANQSVPQAQPITALIDTGASCTSVDPSVIAALNLQPTGSASVITPSTGPTPHQTSQYDVALAIPGSTTQDAALIFPTIAVISAKLLQSQGFHALIGRDILNRCLLTYNGTTKLFTLAY
jgi:predicted aspartyl protease